MFSKISNFNANFSFYLYPTTTSFTAVSLDGNWQAIVVSCVAKLRVFLLIEESNRFWFMTMAMQTNACTTSNWIFEKITEVKIEYYE